jgi:glycosyltransferase involved in cell wall biosynthesis
MLSVVVATHDSERDLVPTLAALVPGAMTGLISEVVVSDGGSADATGQVADITGCRFLQAEEPGLVSLGARLRDAAHSTRTPWLMFLRAGCVPESGWIAACERFMDLTGQIEGAARAAVFRPPAAADLLRPGLSEIWALLRVMLGGGARPEQGLLIARRFYDALAGHPDGADAEAAMLRRIGRRRLTMLGASARTASA